MKHQKTKEKKTERKTYKKKGSIGPRMVSARQSNQRTDRPKNSEEGSRKKATQKGDEGKEKTQKKNGHMKTSKKIQSAKPGLAWEKNRTPRGQGPSEHKRKKKCRKREIWVLRKNEDT